MNYKTKKRNLVTIAVSLLLVFSLTACSLFEFDAKRYVQGTLDAVTKAKFDDYVEMTQSTEEEAKKEYDTAMQQQMATLGAANVSPEMQEKYLEFVKTAFAKFKYEVGDAVKNEDGSYTVPVTTYKLKVFEGCMDKLTEDITAWALEVAESGEEPSETEVADKTMQMMLDILNANLAKAEYGEAVKVDVAVRKDSADSNKYTIDEADSQKVMNACMDVEQMQGVAK